MARQDDNYAVVISSHLYLSIKSFGAGWIKLIHDRKFIPIRLLSIPTYFIIACHLALFYGDSIVVHDFRRIFPRNLFFDVIFETAKVICAILLGCYYLSMPYLLILNAVAIVLTCLVGWFLFRKKAPFQLLLIITIQLSFLLISFLDYRNMHFPENP